MAELKIIPADGPVGFKTIPADKPLLIGSGDSCDVRVKGSGIRDEHCRIGFKKGSFYIEAIEGAREIKLNGAKVENAKLKSDDDISVGKHRFVLKLKPEEEAQLAKASQVAATKAADVYYKPFYQVRLFQAVAGALVVLSAVAVWLYFDYQKKSSEKAYDAAMSEFATGAFPQAIKSFEKFIHDYPSSPMVENAKFFAGYSGVKQYSDGQGASWKQALDEGKKFLADYSKMPPFAEQSKNIAETFAKVAMGLSSSAEKMADADALTKAQDAVKLIDDSFSRADRPDDKMAQIQTQMTSAKLAIEKDARRRETLDRMKSALAEKKPIQLYREHQKLYRTYPDLKADKTFVSLRRKAGDLEKEQVTFEASKEGSPPPPAKPIEAPARTMVFRRPSPEAKKSGNVFAVQVADAVYALDTGSGEVLWRQVVGFEPAFQPVVVKGTGILIHSPADGALSLVDAQTGKPKWRQSTKAVAPAWSCQPVVQGNQFYFYALDAEKSDKARMAVHRLDDGRAVGHYVFPQRLAGSPTYDPERRAILVVGQQVSMYSIQPASRTCDTVVVLDHEPESVHCSPVFKGRFLFLVEEIKAEQSRLRCLVLSEGKAEVRQKQAIDIRGAVWQDPYVNFGKLFITSDLNRFNAYDLKDEKDDNPLTVVLNSADVLESKGDQTYPFAPNVKEFWTVGNKLLAYDLRNALASATIWEMPLDGPPILPPLMDGPLVLITSKQPGGGTISVLALDGATHKEVWKTQLGKQPGAAALDPSDNKTLLVSFGDQTVRLKANDFASDRVVEATLPPDPRIASRVRKPTLYKTIREWSDGVLQWTGVGGKLLVYFAPDGRRLEFPLRSALASRPIVFGKSVLVPTKDGLLYSIDPKTGKETAEPFVGVYSKEGQPTPMGPIAALDPKTLIVVCGQKILRLELATDKSPPEFRENGMVEVTAGPIDQMIGVGGKLLLAYGREMALLDPQEMRLGKKWSIDAAIPREPISLAGVVLLMTDAGELLCVADGPKGTDLRWKIKLEGEPAGVAAAGNSAWVAYSSGKLQRVDLATGKSSPGQPFGRFIVDGPWAPGDRIVALTPDGSLASVGVQGGE